MFTTAQMLEWLFAFLMATAFFAGFGAIGSVIISHMGSKANSTIVLSDPVCDTCF